MFEKAATASQGASNTAPQLHQGDCLDIMRTLANASVDLVLADLPYGTTQNAWDSIIPLGPLWAEYRRVCRGAIVLTAQTPFDKVLGASNLDMLRYEWVWEKTQATGHLNAKKAPLKAHENVLVFYERPPTYNPQMTHGHVRKAARADRVANASTNYGTQRGTNIYDSTSRYPRSVLRYPKDNRLQAIHPTQKPVALLEYLIRTYTNPGDTVLDNCFGSGATGVACAQTGRAFIGMELDPTYYARGRNRVLAAFAQRV